MAPHAFLDHAAVRFVQLVTDANRRADGLQHRLAAAGREVLAKHAGSGYRRPLIKRLATLTLNAMEGVDA